MEKYTPEFCDHCRQQKTYLLPIDRGTTMLVQALARAIRLKGINCIHPGKEMQVLPKDWNYNLALFQGKLTLRQSNNLTRPRIHGLVAEVDGEPGNWCLTRKGGQFLRGEPVKRYAVVVKSTIDQGSHNGGYWGEEMVTVKDFTSDDVMWQGIDFEIIEGRIVTEPVIKKQPQQTLAI